MLKIEDRNLFAKTIADAVARAHLTCRSERQRDRWVNAIAKAAAVLDGDTTFVHWDPHGRQLFYWSSDSNEIYAAGDECQCPAYRQIVPLPCYHRAMSRLVRNYFDHLQGAGETGLIDFADAVFFDRELPARRKIEMLDLSIKEGRVELGRLKAAIEKTLIP